MCFSNAITEIITFTFQRFVEKQQYNATSEIEKYFLQNTEMYKKIEYAIGISVLLGRTEITLFTY